MNYTDAAFPGFFAVTFVAYYLARRAEVQILVLVAASLCFYAWQALGPLAIFLVSWLVTGLASHAVIVWPDRRRATAAAGVVANLALLGFFKYKFLFIHAAAPWGTQTSLWTLLLAAPLPIGISFYTFHGISLLVDVSRGRDTQTFAAGGGLQPHLARTLLYLAFFPQLIAGPIVKARDFFPQVGLKRLQHIDVAGSCQNLVLGLFLKMVVADNLGEQTLWISYPYFLGKSSVDLLVLLYGYSAQIFADFAGYSLVAIGLAKLLGYRLPQNFDFPYSACSIADFWRRWHISLSSWLRDYLYIPLGGSRNGGIRTYTNLVLVMLLGGLWHGAAWSFAIWGLWHGIGLAVERRIAGGFRSAKGSAPMRVLRMVLVFHFVTIGWLFFKLQEAPQVLLYLNSLLRSEVRGISWEAALVGIYGSAVVLYHFAHAWRGRLSEWTKNVIYGLMLFLVILNPGPKVPFIYFQF